MSIKKERKDFVKNGKPVGVIAADDNRCSTEGDALVLVRDERWGNPLFADASLDESDFHIHARITLDKLAGTGASMLLGGHYHYNWSRSQGNFTFRICFDQDIIPSRKNIVSKDTYIVYGATNPREYWHSDQFMHEKQIFDSSRKYIEEGKPFDVDLFRKGNDLILEINNQKIFCLPFEEEANPLTGHNGSNGYSTSVKLGDIISKGRSGDTGWPITVGFLPDYGNIKIHEFYAEGCFTAPEFPTTDVWHMNTGEYSVYRIPSVCRTREGRLLAFAEARRSHLTRGWERHINTGREILSAEIHCAMKSSDDNGKTWSEQTIIPQLEKGFIFEARDPSPVTDMDTGEIFLFSNGPCVVSSKDEGTTWSDMRPLNDALPEGLQNVTTGASTGNSATQFRHGKYKGRLVASFYAGNIISLIYSDDHGKTWKPGASHTSSKNSEPSIVELSDGRLIVSPRHAGKGRKFLLSEDGGETFSEQRCEPAIPMSGQGEIVACESFELEGKGTVRPIVCAGPAVSKTNLTVMVSLDDCETWPISKIIDDGAAANLALVALPEGQVGVLYETDKYHRLSFQVVNIAQLIIDAN